MAPVSPKTVGELIENLKLFPADWPIDFAPFTLHRTKDRGEIVHFEFNEVDGVDYELITEPDDPDATWTE
ncbi:MAG: hypothetical protein AB8B91_20280 [Rubripirellula sp.]